MREYNIGDRVKLKKAALSISYIAGRHFYTNMYEGKTGTVIGYTQNEDKVAIEFDDVVFTSTVRKSSHNNGCHGKGKIDYCWYIPADERFLEEDDNQSLLLLLL
jgi:ribosomal protein L21E